MKLSLFVVLSFLYTVSYSQENDEIFSYYFKSKTTQFNTVNQFKSNQIGEYKLMEGKSNLFSNYALRMEAGENLIIDQTGIYILKNKILSISRTEIRENSKYSISNGYLHGVLKNDSLAVALQDELFYFLMPTKAYLYELSNSNQQLIDMPSDSYLILTQESNTYFSILKIEINNQIVTLSELDMNYKDTKTVQHESITENGIETFILNPTENQWNMILSHFISYELYSVY